MSPFESSLAGAGVRAPEQQRPSCGEMRNIFMSGFKHADTQQSRNRGTASLFKSMSVNHQTKQHNSPSFVKLSSCDWSGYEKMSTQTINNTTNLTLMEHFGGIVAFFGELSTSPVANCGCNLCFFLCCRDTGWSVLPRILSVSTH